MLPSGRRVRGRGLRHAVPGPTPTFALYLAAGLPATTACERTTAWESRWIRWRDFSLPADPAELRQALADALVAATDGRVEVACRGGTGRTGTALACLAVLDGVRPEDAVDFVRRGYRRRAVETPGQRAFVRNFAGAR